MLLSSSMQVFILNAFFHIVFRISLHLKVSHCGMMHGGNRAQDWACNRSCNHQAAFPKEYVQPELFFQISPIDENAYCYLVLVTAKLLLGFNCNRCSGT
jgi:hypothetical protein